jgi:hypothetical protein
VWLLAFKFFEGTIRHYVYFLEDTVLYNSQVLQPFFDGILLQQKKDLECYGLGRTDPFIALAVKTLKLAIYLFLEF